jgi:hypothetical protein
MKIRYTHLGLPNADFEINFRRRAPLKGIDRKMHDGEGEEGKDLTGTPMSV